MIPSGGFWNRGNLYHARQSIQKNLSIILKPKPEDGETTAVPLFAINIHVTEPTGEGEAKPGGVTTDFTTTDVERLTICVEFLPRAKTGPSIVNTRDVDLRPKHKGKLGLSNIGRVTHFGSIPKDDFAPSQLDLSMKGEEAHSY